MSPPGSAATPPPGRLTAVYSAKGGAGRTTIATNLAAVLGGREPGRCLLIDLGLPYNHVSLTAKLVPQRCLALCANATEQEFAGALLASCHSHPSGMMVLPATLRVEQSELISPDLVERALAILATTFEEIVVDLGVSLSEVCLSVLEQARAIVIIVTPELTTLKDTGEVLGILRSVLGISDDRLRFVLNHPRPGTPVTLMQVERAIGHRIEFDVAYDGRRFDQASVSGDLVVISDSGCPAARFIHRLAASLRPDLAGGSIAGLTGAGSLPR